MKYPKIDTLWKRDPAHKNHIIEGDYSKAEFTNIMTWIFTEKIDGENIRVSYDGSTRVLGIGEVPPSRVRFDGRTDDAQISSDLYAALTSIFPVSEFKKAFAPTETDKESPKKVILFGEGYGPKIHGGGLYRDDPGFILFDVWIDGWWLERSNVEDIAKKFGVPVVPIIGIGSIELGVDMVKSVKQSIISKQSRPIEGIVARSFPLVLFRNGNPVMWKLKVKDYTALKGGK